MTTTLSPRQERGIKLYQAGAVKMMTFDLFTVESETGVGAYRVERDGYKWKCNCPDFVKRELPCKHILAVDRYLIMKKTVPEDSLVKDETTTYGQNWSAYNEAQTNEAELFDKYLRDLVLTVEEPEQKLGRPRISLSDSLFVAIEKIYSQVSSRRANSMLGRTIDNGHLAKKPHFNHVSKILRKPEITPILLELVRESAWPLKSLEDKVEIDSSGFRTSSFNRYCEEKHGTKREVVWLKAHICIGVKTNVITSVTITEGNANDCPQFKGLLERTAKDFTISEVTADKAYSSRENLTLVENLGGTPFIAFKLNSRATRKGSAAWNKSYHYFQLHREEFEKHYHKRSNVEATFASLKRKFGETLKSKDRTAQINELLCKVIAYNITVMIQELAESGINNN